MSLAKEFKEFAMRGNVVDLAVGVVIGAAFGKIVTALVDQILMPPLGLLIGGVDFSELAIVLREASGDVPAVTIGIGDFVNTLIQFVIIAFAIFLVVKGINRLNRKEEAKEEAKPAEPSKPGVHEEQLLLLREIRDALNKR